MSTPEKPTLNGRDYERRLTSIRSTAQRIKKLIDDLDEDRAVLEAPGYRTQARILEEAATVLRVGLAHLRDVFKEL